MVEPVFEEDWQNRMTLATANTSFALLREEKSATSAAELGKRAMAATSTLVDNLLSQAPAGSVACHSGCAHCCHQRVGITVPEALAIVTHLVETRSAEALADVRRRVERAHDRTRGLSREQRNSPDHPCPLLEEGTCSIYEVRPLSCRGVHSIDERACKAKLHDTKQRAAYDRGELPGHSFAEPIRAVHAVSAGVQLGLSEGLGLDMRPLDLTAALRLLLREPTRKDAAPHPDASRIASWLDGSAAFAEAHGGDASDDQRFVALSGALGVTKSCSKR